ncbi:MAG: hypothetical protein ACRETF_11485 [Nevskiaceae bacterium]
MRTLALAVAVLLGVVMNGQAEASGAFTGRVGATAGNYSQDETFTDTGCCGNPIGTEFTFDYSTGQYGVLGGLGFTISRFFVDAGLEFTQYAKDRDTDFDGIEDTAFYRSDFLLTAGVFLGDRWTTFLGFRHSTQGDGFFSEDLGFTADGPFFGAGVSFRPGQKFAVGASAAYNVLTYSQEGVVFDNVDLNGLSVKLQGSFLGTPHSVFLRWQRFNGDQSEAGSFDYEQTEDYVNVGYQATFDFLTW